MIIELFVLLFSVSFFFSHGADPNACQMRPSQKNTTTILADLRQEMQKENISVYVIFADDEHGSEYTQPYDKRRNWISGFRGSAGTAVVSLTDAAVWTDSRYFTQAEEELDCANWLLMKTDNPGVPTLIDWVVSETNKSTLPPGTTAVFTSSSWWSSANAALKDIGKQVQAVPDLIDRIWPSGERPPASTQPIVVHDVTYAGETVAQKLNRTTTEMRRVGASTAVISALDEVAWLFNLRGADIPYNPFFKSYAIIYVDYTVDKPDLFLSLTQLNVTNYPAGVNVYDYSAFWSHLETSMNKTTVTKVWASPRVSQALLNLIPTEKLIQPMANSPVQRIKARKNPIERQGMRECQIRDAVARVKHLGWLEQQLNEGIAVNETQSAERLLFYQKQQDRFQMASFNTISASGDRAAVVHYAPQPETARRITKDSVYLLDAGGQYLDCTTDITRTHHFGTPKDLEKRAYTRVLQGVLDVADAVFPTGTMGRSIDFLGRMSLYRDGMTFGHGVGHGIGHFLSVHEGPQRIASVYNQYEEALADGMFVSDEPGFYLPDDFGIRIEDDVEVVLANKSSYDSTQYLRFDTITLIPYELSLININLLTEAQIAAIDKYHEKVSATLEPLLDGDAAALNALRTRTRKLADMLVTETSAATSSSTAGPIVTSSSTGGPGITPSSTAGTTVTTTQPSLSTTSKSTILSLSMPLISLLMIVQVISYSTKD